MPGLSGDPEPGVRLRALHGAQTSPAPAALKPERTPRAPGSCPWCRRARVSARRAASRPGFQESGGQRGAGSAWARRPGSCGKDSEPRRTARPKDVCAAWAGDPGDRQALSRHFPAERNRALLMKTNKRTNPKQVAGCEGVAGQPSPAGSGWHSFFMNWQHVYVNILINRETASPIYIIWGPPRLLEGVRKKMRWKAIYFPGVGG